MTPAGAPSPDPARAAPSRAGLIRGLVIGGVVAAAAYALLAAWSDADAVLAAAREVPASSVALALAASTGNFALRGARWRLYLRRLGVAVPATDAWLVFLAGLSMSLTPGKVGELLKPGLLHDRHGAPIVAVTTAVAAERITDLLAVAGLMGVGALAQPVVAPAAALVCLGVAGATAALAWRGLQRRVLALVGRLPGGPRVATLAERVLEPLAALSHPATLAPALALAVGAWGLQCVSLYVVAAPLAGLELGPLESILAYTAPLLAGAVALVPGGVGVAEATMAGLVAEVGAAPGTAPEVALTLGSAATAITRAVTLWWALAVGLAALAAWGWRGRRAPPVPAAGE